MVFVYTAYNEISTTSKEKSTPFVSLSSLSNSVKQYQNQNLDLPSTLSTMKTFPSTAIEWLIDLWASRNPQGLAEILWDPYPDKENYAIILRTENKAWIYDSDNKFEQINAK